MRALLGGAIAPGLLLFSCASATVAQEAPGYQPTVSTAVLDARPVDAGSAVGQTEFDHAYRVTLTYEIVGDWDPTTASALPLDGARILDFSASLDGRDLEVSPRDSTLWVVELGGGGVGGMAAARVRGVGAKRVLVLEYHVGGAVGPSEGATEPARLSIPVVVLDLNPPEALPGVFRGTVALPEGTAVRAGFPSTIIDRGGTAHAELAFVPRVVRVRLAPGPLGPLGRLSVAEAVATLLILVFGALGWRHLQGGQGGGREGQDGPSTPEVAR